ncbi:uncharacterized protein LOC131684753 [Topomyia yanbarensis]|uniref:uncharacterized protein LOC131684753 n=1 Tax=Topomyia yanbarensis TaxID=2498891 RepID=UPI00273B5579|nr:uncharacterized protein LOC131684753 [Topomyia yanbarensis]
MSYASRIDGLRKGFGKKSSAFQTVQELQDLFDGIGKQVDREKAAIYVFKELLDEYMDLDDDKKEQCQALLVALKYLIEQCKDADEAVKRHFVPRIYNVVVKIINKENKRYMIIKSCQLMHICPAMDEHMELYLRISKVALKVVCELHGKPPKVKCTEYKEAISDGLDFICSTSLRLVRCWSNSEEVDVRAKALAIFHDVFNNGTALLYRLFSIEPNRATQFFNSIVDAFRIEGRFSPTELIEMFQSSITYLETILSLGEANRQYMAFVRFLDVFDRIEGEPVASYVKVLKTYLKFQSDSAPDEKKLIWISEKLKDLSGSFVTDPLLVEVVVFIILQLRIHIDQMKLQVQGIAMQAIELCKTLTKFSKHCPRNVSQICARCESSSRHLIDYISTMVVHIAMIMSKAGHQISPEMVALVNGFLKHKLLTLDAMNCDKKQSLLDTGLRFAANWVRASLQVVSGRDLLELVRMVTDFKYRHGFDFLTPSYLIRLVENCLKDTESAVDIIDIKLVKLLMVLREKNDDTEQCKELDEIVYAVINHQINGTDESIRQMNIVQLLVRADLQKFGFPVEQDLNNEEKTTILLAEMNWASRYKNCNILDYFHLLRQLNADALKLGMTIYMLGDGSFNEIPDETVDALKVQIQNARPKTAIDRIRRHSSLGVLYYYAYSARSKATVNKLKSCALHKETINNDQINDVLMENLMDQEAILLSQLEQTYTNFREMVLTLAETSFQHFSLIYSLNQIASMLDNTSHFYQICYHPRRAVEMQLLNYMLVSQKPNRMLDMCRSLGHLIENWKIYQQLLDDPVYKNHCIPSLHQLVQKTLEIIASNEAELLQLPETRQYHFLNLYVCLAMYSASESNLSGAINYLQKLNTLLQQLPEKCSNTISIVRGRIYHALFRLITVYHLPPPQGISPRILIRLMLGHFNEMQKLTTDHAFAASTSTLEMTVDTMRYLMLRYDTDRIEPHVEQILRFVLRRGAGLRALHILAMYAAMSADSEKEDKCRMLLTYMDRLLMFRPLGTNGKAHSHKIIDPILQASARLEIPFISLEDSPNTVDQTRKAVKLVKSPSKRSPSPNLFPEEKIDAKRYIIQHHTGCSCQFCTHPQYKCQSLLTLASYARLAFLKNRSADCRNLYEALAHHWKLRKHTYSCSSLIGYDEEFLTFLARSFMHYGQFLSKEGQLELAREEFNKSIDMLQSIKTVDLDLVEEVEMNIEALKDLQTLDAVIKPTVNLPSYAEFLKKNPRNDYAPVVEFDRLELRTPKVGTNRLIPKTVMQSNRVEPRTPKVGTVRLIPKTACRADDLLKQVARKRLKTTLAKDFSEESTLISAMSGLSCGSERKPKTVRIFVDSPEKPLAEAQKNDKKQPFAVNISAKQKEITPKRRGRKKKVEGETPAGPKSTRKKRIPLSPCLKSSSSNESFKDILVKAIECSTPKTNNVTARSKARTTSKKPKLVSDFPKLKRSESKSPRAEQNLSLNSSYRDVLLKSLTEGSKPNSNDSCVIILDDSDHEVVNTSLNENNSVTESNNGTLSLKKYSERNAQVGYGSARKTTVKTRLQFDTSVIDITTPVSSPAVSSATELSSAGSAGSSAGVVRKVRGRPKGGKTPQITTVVEDATSVRVTRRKGKGKIEKD